MVQLSIWINPKYQQPSWLDQIQIYFKLQIWIPLSVKVDVNIRLLSTWAWSKFTFYHLYKLVQYIHRETEVLASNYSISISWFLIYLVPLHDITDLLGKWFSYKPPPQKKAIQVESAKVKQRSWRVKNHLVAVYWIKTNTTNNTSSNTLFPTNCCQVKFTCDPPYYMDLGPFWRAYFLLRTQKNFIKSNNSV